MKCPDCGDTEQQEWLGSDNEAASQARYRCPKCGRLYSVPADIAGLTHHLSEMKARLHFLGLEMGSLARQIGAAHAKLLELHEQHAAEKRTTERE